MKIIAFSGKMGVGKSEAIKIIRNILNDKFNIQLFKFAQPLYDIQEYIYKRVARDTPVPKDRKLLQWLGTDWGREIDQNIWVDLWELDIKHAAMFSTKELLVVCDDVRFDNEADKVKALGGTVIELTSNKRGERINLINENHASEKGIDRKYINYTIENNGTLNEFRDKIIQALVKEDQNGY